MKKKQFERSEKLGTKMGGVRELAVGPPNVRRETMSLITGAMWEVRGREEGGGEVVEEAGKEMTMNKEEERRVQCCLTGSIRN